LFPAILLSYGEKWEHAIIVKKFLEKLKFPKTSLVNIAEKSTMLPSVWVYFRGKKPFYSGKRLTLEIRTYCNEIAITEVIDRFTTVRRYKNLEDIPEIVQEMLSGVGINVDITQFAGEIAGKRTGIL
jgi:hypothetical protein